MLTPTNSFATWKFGDAYFRLSEILHISEPAYRAISPAIHGDAIEFEGEAIPLVPENAARIRQAVARLRADLKRTRTSHWFAETHVMQHELDLALDHMQDINRRCGRVEDLTGVQNLCTYAINRLQSIAGENAAAQASLSTEPAA